MTHVWPDYTVLREHVPTDESRLHVILSVGQAIVDRVANVKECEPLVIWQGLWRGAITGDLSALRIIRDTFGTEGMRLVSQWRTNTKKEAESVAKSLGL
jgi:hypothetical protein